MTDAWTRRRLIITGSAGLLLTAGCGRERQSSRAPTAAPTNARPGGIWYDVVEGDTLSSIARRSGTTVQAIVDGNNLKTNLLVPQTRLWLPGASTVGADPLAHIAEPETDIVPPTAMKDDEPEPEPDLSPLPGNGYVLVPRSKWTRNDPRSNSRPMGRVTRITLHHTAEHGSVATLPDIEVVRRIENYHRNGRKWCAIGYHYLVGKDGRVYEGRPANLQGAHVLSENENNIGISMMGDFDKKMPSARQLAALKAFLDDTRDRFKVSKGRVYGHRDLNRSICPGDALYGWLRKTYRA
jgi:N-acetylmuramoyl-L-alanine amidase